MKECVKINLSLWFPYFFFFPSLALIFSLVFFFLFFFSFCIYLCLKSQYYIMCIIPNFILHKLSYFTPWIDWAMITSCEHTVSLPLFLFLSFLFFNELGQHFEIVGYRCSCYRTYKWLLWSMSGPLRVKRHAAQTYFVPEYLHLFPVAQNKKFTGEALPFLSTWCNLKIGNELRLRLQGINIKAYSMLCSTCFSILF